MNLNKKKEERKKGKRDKGNERESQTNNNNNFVKSLFNFSFIYSRETQVSRSPLSLECGSQLFDFTTFNSHFTQPLQYLLKDSHSLYHSEFWDGQICIILLILVHVPCPTTSHHHHKDHHKIKKRKKKSMNQFLLVLIYWRF